MSTPEPVELSAAELDEARAEKKRLIEGAVLRVAAWGYVALNFGKHGLFRPLTQPGVDYPKHWHAARAVLENESTYLGEWLWMGFNYPQWSAFVSFWIGWLPMVFGERVWKMIGLVMILSCWWMAWNAFRPGPPERTESRAAPGETRRTIARGMQRHWGLVCALMLVAFSPAGTSSIHLGQIEPINAFLIMAFVTAVILKRDRLAGSYWAMLILVKMMPAVLIIPVLMWRRWKIVQGCALFGAGYALLLTLLGRWKYEWFFLTEMAEHISFYWRGLSISLPRAILLLFFPSAWHDDPVLYNRFINAGIAIQVIVYAACIVVIRKRGWSFMRSLEMGILFVPLLSPLLENHHLAWALPVFFLHAARWVRGEMSNRIAIVLAIGWWLVCFDFFARNLMTNLGEWILFVSMPGMYIVVIACMVEIWRERPPEAPAIQN